MDETVELFELVELVARLRPEHRWQVVWLAREFADWELGRTAWGRAEIGRRERAGK